MTLCTTREKRFQGKSVFSTVYSTMTQHAARTTAVEERGGNRVQSENAKVRLCSNFGGRRIVLIWDRTKAVMYMPCNDKYRGYTF